MSNASDQSQIEDLNEYVAECDEHLSAARKVLLDLEATRDPAAAGREPLDALFRAFHTIKGLSGMVGARAAEESAHHLEAYLGAVRKGEIPLTEAGIDTLLAGIHLLEEAVEAFRSGGSPPPVTPLAEQITALMPARPAVPESLGLPEAADAPSFKVLPAEKQARLDAALLRGERAWHVEFTPSPALATAGMNVNTVRGRLQGIGEIIHAEPQPTPGGVRFRFVVTGKASHDFHGWEDEGITAAPYEPPADARPAEGVPARGHGPAAAGIAPSNLVRVDLERLDDLMRGVGELVLSRARLEGGLVRIARFLPASDRRELEETALTIERQLRALREGVMRVRMVPIGDLFARMRLVVRDISRESGKDVDLVVLGEETEVDKFIVQRMADPLLHMVRNAVSHGLETRPERVAAGKPEKGRLILRAGASAGMIVIEVEDDGRGIRADEVFSRARAIGLAPSNAPTDAAALLDLLCAPGFSTREQADLASGRGVGMDVVRLAVESLGGSLALETRPGAGSRFTARLPLTLLVADVLTVVVGGQIYAVPKTAVREVIPVELDASTPFENNELVRYHGGVLPLLRLGDLLGVPRPNRPFVALVTGEGAGLVALAADRALGLREVVVRALADPLIQVPGIGGATELGDGRPILILEPAGLVRLARRQAAVHTRMKG